MPRHTSDREQGFTLIELLMAMTISGILIVALATGFVSTMRGTAGAHERFVASNGAHTLATYLTSDALSANPSLATTDPVVDSGCASTPGSTTNVLRLQWSEKSSATKLTAFSVSYRTRQVGSGWQLVRYACSGWQDPGTTMSAILATAVPSSTVVASDIFDPTPPSANPTAATMSGRKVSLTVFSAIAQGATAPFSYTVSASMRTPALVPSVLSINRLDADPTTADTVRWTVRFSDDVSGVDSSDFALAPSGVTAALGSVVAVDAKTYTVTATTVAGNGTLALNLVDDDTIVDGDGDELGDTGLANGNYTGQAYTIDNTVPSVTIDKKVGQADPASSLPILFEVNFSESVVGFDAADVARTGTAPGGTIAVTGSGAVYEVAVTGVTGDGTVILSVPAGGATDLAGNGNAISTSTDNTVTFAAPPMVVSIDRTDPSPTNAGTLRWTVTFNKAVTGVDNADFALAPTGAVTGAGSIDVTGSGTTYTVSADRGSGAGTLGLNLVDDDSITSGGVSLIGAAGADGAFTGQTYTITGMITGVELKNGSANPGQLEENDAVIVSFAEAMDTSTFCSSWSGTGNQTLSGTGPGSTTVTVTAENNSGATGHDVVKVSVGKCAFNFGAIDLGTAGFVTGSGNATFGGSGGNSSTVTWNGTTKQITITLGKYASGTLSAVGVDVAPVYTASTDIRSATNQPIDNSPFTLPSGRQF